MKLPRRVPKIVVAMLISAFVVACGDSTGPASSHEGTYSLRSVDGRPLPLVMYDDADLKWEIPSGSLVLKAGGVCSTTVMFRETDKRTNVVTNDPETGSCHYVIAGTSLTITDDEDATKTTAVISGDSVTLSDDNVYVFSK